MQAMLSAARVFLQKTNVWTAVAQRHATTSRIADYVIVDHTYDAVVVGAGLLKLHLVVILA